VTEDLKLRILTILTISLFFSIPLTAQVESLNVEVIPPFPKAKGIVGFGYSLLNTLHFDSKPWTVRRLCPISTGDSITTIQMDDAARILRSYPFWGDAQILSNADSNVFTAQVQDLWTTKVNASLRYIVNELEWSLALEEENLGGFGAYISGGYAHNVDKDWWQFGTKIYGFPTRKWDLSGYYNRNGNEWQAGGSLLKPDERNPSGDLVFLSAGAESISINRYFSGGAPKDTVERDFKYAAVEYLFKIDKMYLGGAGGYIDKSLQNRYVESGSSAIPITHLLSENSHIRVPLMIRFSLLSREFVQLRNLDNFKRIEDISLGWCADCAIGFDANSKSRIEKFVVLSVSHATIHFERYWAWRTNLTSKYGDEELSFGLKTFSPIDTMSLMRLGISGECILFSYRNLDKLLIVDGRNGFRGFPAYYAVQNGDGTFLKISSELRLFPHFEFLTLQPGFALFADFGGVSEEFLPDRSGLIVDAGISLRLASTRSTTGNVNRFEFSYSPQTKTWAFTLDSGQAFSFYLPLGIGALLPE